MRSRIEGGNTITEESFWTFFKDGRVNRLKYEYNENEDSQHEAIAANFDFQTQMGLNLVSQKECQDMIKLLNLTSPK